ncbi:glycerophosphodiester phosphodiesterase [Cohnella sp. JJ-181]|uniref:glycerophosphodiester phosphodiesterase n=1 Tax=Cohnella rhizoplanae TaxID=2974897 RepID=UPI0022FF5338|nr:glycerophosphodiester phosphodiesterase family protein [Cohnella sp. JJ-181]CAI6085576.1 Glycerophosphodiester phosphodiesterase, cytoplasmic [Cohnella sp. JJ-181]
MPKRPQVAAHTGCGESPDNTMASFLEGVDSGADIVEVDVHAAMDGTAVLLHDESLLLQTCTYEQLNRPEVRKRIDDAYLTHEVATLEQILQASESWGTSLNIDLKSAASIEPAVKLIRKYGAQRRIHITGYSASMTARYPDIPVMLNAPVELSREQLGDYDGYVRQLCNETKEAGYAGLNMHYRTCMPALVETAHAHGLSVWVYTVNERAEMERMISLGVDAITTRRPVALRKLLTGDF